MVPVGRGFRPDFVYPDLFSVDLGALRRRGVRALCVDLDNTLVPWNGPPDERALAWLDRARSFGFRVALVSNNSRRRTAEFARRTGLPIVAPAQKPRRAGIRRALALLGTPPEEAAVIGDQLWTDVWGGNRAGCTTVLVRPVDRREFAGTRVARLVEAAVLAWLSRSEGRGQA
ncbi:MAG: YqeG family HAD IIIA-type phosphatase [Clostridia bacterium]|nr:YqeG family HAD IIIA-type phosphatase [Clostridia bacterium]